MVRDLQQQHHIVAMAGDGINDAPALAQADIGIAMGTGADIAIEAAAPTLFKGDLGAIVRARRLSRAIRRNIRQNLFFAFIFNGLAIPDRRRRPLPGLRPPAQPNDRQRRDERQLGARRQQRLPPPPRAALTLTDVNGHSIGEPEAVRFLPNDAVVPIAFKTPQSLSLRNIRSLQASSRLKHR